MKTSIRNPRSRGARRLAAATATALLALGPAAPALAHDDDKPSWNTSPISISPSSGGPNTSVTVRVTCQPSGSATSDAFQQNITLRQTSGNQWTGTGRIKSSGLQTGRSYPVTVRCNDGTTLTTNFTFTSATPSGGAAAGFGGSNQGSGTSGGTQATALAVGGAVAIAGSAGYVFLARRRRSTGNHY
ncbi:LPXTG cell wall anchor domain-containing protein [Streptomyces sp. NPDC049879]|uniref:LPXTG cell wall anchor domain-containing protein n=1 Tax=Streptomyces sp. NPDC049879 TaxID=3365598 RepID=UPI003797376E